MKVVVALGGNAILRRGDAGTIAEQRAAIREAVDPLARAVAGGDTVVVTHGNGPQVGRLMMQDEAMPDRLPRHPLDVHVAATQGQLGYLLQQELDAALRRADTTARAVTVVTQVVVDEDDPAFLRPTKPVGPYLSNKGLAEYRARGVAVAEVSGGGWRRVVPSPRPRQVVEADVVAALADRGTVVVAAGGGGIPVVREGNGYRGVGAVVDKDLTSAILAEQVAADTLVIATDVDAVYIGYGGSEARALRRLTTDEAEAQIAGGAFARGSMAEKVEAAARFARAGRRAVIGPLARLDDVLAGSAGTEVVA